MNKLFLAAAGAAALLLTACSSGSGQKAAGQAAGSSSRAADAGAGSEVASAVAATLKADAHVAMSLKIEASGEPDVPAVDIVGGYNMGVGTGQLVASLGTKKITEVFTADEVYLTRAAEGDDRWVRIPRAKVVAHYLFRTPANDPAAFVRQVGELGAVKAVGADVVGGVSMKHYRGVFSDKALTEYIAADKRADVAKLGAMFGPFSADVWVDPEGRIGRVSVAYDAQAVKSTTRLDLTYPGDPAPKVPADADSVEGTGETGGILVG